MRQVRLAWVVPPREYQLAPAAVSAFAAYADSCTLLRYVTQLEAVLLRRAAARVLHLAV